MGEGGWIGVGVCEVTGGKRECFRIDGRLLLFVKRTGVWGGGGENLFDGVHLLV